MNDPITLLVVGRVLERALIVAGGLLALWLGFRLFALVSKERANTVVQGFGLLFKAERIGPGVFFALFGAGILAHSAFTRLDVSVQDLRPIVQADKPPTPEKPAADQRTSVQAVQIRLLGPAEKEEIPVTLKAVNTLISIKTRYANSTEEIKGVDYRRLMAAIPNLEHFQKLYIDSKYEPGTFDTIMALNRECEGGTPRCRSYRAQQENAARMDEIVRLLGITFQ